MPRPRFVVTEDRTRFMVCLKIAGRRDGEPFPYTGCGVWACGLTVEAARESAKRELRRVFGPGLLAVETVERMEAEA